jgi:hypothetical protein
MWQIGYMNLQFWWSWRNERWQIGYMNLQFWCSWRNERWQIGYMNLQSFDGTDIMKGWSWGPCSLQAQVRRLSISGIARSNPNDCINVRVLCLLCVVLVAASTTNWSLVRRSPTGYVCVSVCDLETSTVRWPRPKMSCWPQKNNLNICGRLDNSRSYKRYNIKMDQAERG